MILKSFFSVPVVAVIFFSLVPYPAGAVTTGLTIQPIKISETINPGNQISGVITLSNASSQDVKVELSVEDFVPTSGTTNINFVGRAEGNTTVRDWIELERKGEFIFKNGESLDIPYTITAPENAEPGGHFGVIFFKATEIKNGGQLKVGTRVGVLVFVTVPGNQLQKGNILDFKTPFFVSDSAVPFTISFENTGNVHFEPKGEITIKNMLGKEVGKAEVSGQAVLPTGVRDISVSWQTEKILFGRYTASLSIADGDGNILGARDVYFYTMPLSYILWFVGGTIVLFIIFKVFRNKIKISISVTK